MPITYRPLTDIPLPTILATFNAAFKDYLVPVDMKLDLFKYKCQNEDIDMALSTGAFSEGELVGVILRGCREMEGGLVSYNGGTGVVPEHRGKRLVAGMYEAAMPAMKERGLSMELLEVIVENGRAIRVYQRLGFRALRKLDGFKGIPKPATLPPHYSLVQVAPSVVFRYEDLWKCVPSWQYMPKGILKFEDRHRFLAVKWEGKAVATMVFDPTRNRLLHLFVQRGHRNKQIGAALVRHIYEAKKEEVAVVNVDSIEGAGMGAFFEAIGMEHFLSQWEMAMQIP